MAASKDKYGHHVLTAETLDWTGAECEIKLEIDGMPRPDPRWFVILYATVRYGKPERVENNLDLPGIGTVAATHEIEEYAASVKLTPTEVRELRDMCDAILAEEGAAVAAQSCAQPSAPRDPD